MHTRARLASDVRSLGVTPGDVVMLHASIRAVGPVAGGPDEIHLALGDALGETGTLVMYASCPRYVDEIGRGNLDAATERELLENLPAFDPYTARAARENGALVELVRTWPGARVNAHPARFVVRGAAADALLEPQPWDFAFGAGSLLERFVMLGGRILLLGSDHDQVTFLHHAEHIVDIPDKRVARFRVPVLEEGRRVWRWMAEYDTADGVHANWPPDFFARIVDGYLRHVGNDDGRVGDAPSHLFAARELLDFTLPVMRAVARDRGAADRLVPASG